MVTLYLLFVFVEIESHYKLASKLLAAFKLVFYRMNRRLLIEARATTVTPSWPVKNRWGTWIRSASFVHSVFQDVVSLMSIINVDDPPGFTLLDEALKDRSTYEELLEVKKLDFLCGSITKLEKVGLTRFEQGDILAETKAKSPGLFERKLFSSLDQNPDIKRILSDDLGMIYCQLHKYHYAPKKLRHRAEFLYSKVDLDRSSNFIYRGRFTELLSV